MSGGVLGVGGQQATYPLYSTMPEWMKTSSVPGAVPGAVHASGATFSNVLQAAEGGTTWRALEAEAGPLFGQDAGKRVVNGVPYASLFNAAGAEHGVSPQLLASVARAESSFNPKAISSAGAIGLMQFMPGTASSMNVDPTDPESSVGGAARMLSGLFSKYQTAGQALAAYNAGAGWLDRAGGEPTGGPMEYARKVLGWIS
jgi:soluble lytic murein transglycosylase-like protein